MYFSGTKEEWEKISLGTDNENFSEATIKFDKNYCEHDYEETITYPTCVKQGYTTYICPLCDDSYIDDYIDATDHSWSDWQISVKPTETEEGTETRACESCGEIESRIIPCNAFEVKLISIQGEVVREQYVSDELKEVSFENVENGEYTVIVSRENYVAREYRISVTNGNAFCEFSINKIGDINGDDIVNAIDVAKANAHSKGVSALIGYELACVDINGDGKVNAVDVARINAHSKGIISLW